MAKTPKAKSSAKPKKLKLDEVGTAAVHSDITFNIQTQAGVIYAQTSWTIPAAEMPEGVTDKDIATHIAARIRRFLEQDARLDDLIAQVKFAKSRKKT